MATSPYNVDQEISSLCSTGLKPNLLTGVILKLLTRHFSTAKGIQEPQLKDYIWSNTPAASKILIVPVWRWLVRTSQLRPAIVIKRNALRPRTIALGDGQALVPGLSEDKIPMNQEVTSQIAVAGSHTIFAIAELATQAELLSTEIFLRLIQYQQAIQEEFMFNRFRVAEVGPLARLDEHSESFVVPITVAYAYVDAWQIWSTAPFLKRLVLETTIA